LTNPIDFIQLIHALGAEGPWFESSLPDQIPLLSAYTRLVPERFFHCPLGTPVRTAFWSGAMWVFCG
jgi:hypothetical protein